jgi:RNA polymerase sigma factor (sigma-70 family)
VVARIIASKARCLIGRHGFRYGDYDDLVQQFTLEWLRYRPTHDPGRSSLSTYATRVIENAVAGLLRRRHAAKRDPGGRVLSWETVAETMSRTRIEEGVYTSKDEPVYARRGEASRGPRDLQMDLDAFLPSLPERLRRLCAGLKSMTVSEYARRTGTPRSTVYEAIHELRRRFEDAGLADYLPTPR